LRERILAAYDAGEGTREEVARRFRVSLGMVKKFLQQRRHTGSIAPRHHLAGRKPQIVLSHQRAMRTALGQKPDLTLQELRRAVGLECSLQAIHVVLVKMGLTYKKTLRAAEQDRPDIARARRHWGRRQGGLDPARLVFLDESGAKTNMTRLRGRAPRGQRCHGSAPAGHWQTTTLIAALRLDGTTAAMTIPGATDTEVFRAYVAGVLCPSLRAGDIVIMDNLAPHHSEPTLELITAAGASVLFLPAYSPDLNPIEKMWSKGESAPA
jgi:transposase